MAIKKICTRRIDDDDLDDSLNEKNGDEKDKSNQTNNDYAELTTTPNEFRATNSATGDSDLDDIVPLENVFSLSEPDQGPNELNDNNMDIVYNNKTMRDVYLKTRQDICDHSSQKDWWIELCNVSNNFRQYQITNIDKLEEGGTFCFSSDCEEILSLHHIMLIDLTNMKKPQYVSTGERNWRTAVRQPNKPNIASFFRDVMDEYEMVINDIDLLRSKFYEMWGRYCDQVIYSDNERRLFETTQAVTRFYERMHMYLSNSEKVNNEDTIMHEYIHDTSKKRSGTQITIPFENGEREESCFIEVKDFSRNSNVGGYNMYKVAIFCQESVNKMISTCEDTGASFGGHICVKLARKLSEFNLVRRLIMEAFFFKCRIDDFYSNRNGSSNQTSHNNFSRRPTISPKAPRKKFNSDC
ncbi:hypothetical protein C1645_812661 [Glomus cerebriforme]|uniref:Uncharacterized protein n=1 Tax=Glomus cerebriforme TaxID=658196 RepID=A0A397TNC2_9GLOM|nr:hypothetical protein C1645_812661 [Glomus cerebriforme]